MPQRGFVVEQNPLNIVTFRQFLRDLTAGIFAPLLLVTIKSLRGTLLYMFALRANQRPFHPEGYSSRSFFPATPDLGPLKGLKKPPLCGKK